MQAFAWPGITQVLSNINPPSLNSFGNALSLIVPLSARAASTHHAPPSIRPTPPPIPDAARDLLRSFDSRQFISSHTSHAFQHRKSAQSLIYPFLRPQPSRTPSNLFSRSFSSARSQAGPTQSRRSISLWSRFGNSSITSQALAKIRLLEVDVAQNPKDVSKQVALWEALYATSHKDGYSKVVGQWERIAEFEPTSPVLHSDTAFETYLKSLIASDQAASIPPAIRRRDEILAAHPLVVEAVSPPVVESVSASQAIANKVLGETAASPSRWPFSSPAPASTTLAADGKTGPIRVVLEESRGFMVWRIVRFTGLTLLFGFIGLTFLSMMLENSGVMKAGPSQKQWEPATGKTVKFSDVHGVDEAKEDLEEIVEFLKDPTKFASLGGRLPKGVLLTGPPGTGKTMLAKAVAGEAGVPFLFASGSEFDEIFVGTGAKRVRELFAAARKKQPAIIFIDELDAIGSKRSAKDQHYMKQTLNQLLVELDGFKESEGTIVIAATNFPESLDSALVRPGRFDKKVVVPLPDVKGRAQILAHHMRDILSDVAVDPVILARGTSGFSGADLQNLVNQAAIQASREGAPHVGLKHFEWAKDKIVMGAERKSAVISPREKSMTAYHEAGHALVALYTDGAIPLHKVTCMPRGHSLGLTQLLPTTDRVSESYTNYTAMIDVAMGGRAAEEIVYGPKDVTSGCSSDIKNATNVATSMVRYYGYSDALGPVFFGDDTSPAKRNEIDSEIRQLLKDGFSRAKSLLEGRRDELTKLAEALVEHETLNLEEVQKVIKGEKIRQKELELDQFSQELGFRPSTEALATDSQLP